ncbi:MAG: hypothetical protein HQK91_03425 [Nitrospirae bacterium]|nr:hypothetical protein [Nitrospirota bacterium]
MTNLLDRKKDVDLEALQNTVSKLVEVMKNITNSMMDFQTKMAEVSVKVNETGDTFKSTMGNLTKGITDLSPILERAYLT